MKKSENSNRPRVWPSLVVGVGALVLAGIVSNIVLYIVISPTLEPGQEFGQEVIGIWMQENMATSRGFLTMVTPIHLSLLLFALLVATRSRTTLKDRLGLVRGSVSIWHYPILMLSCLGAAAISGWVFLAHISPSEDQMALARAFTQASGLDGFLITAYTATMAALSEELLFRGFVLRGLLRRWNPALAIGLVAILFSLIHPDPFFMLHALPIGIWTGIIVWRTRSIWPAIACHSFLNVALALLNRWYPEPTIAFFGEFTVWPIVIGAFGVIMMGLSSVLLFRAREN